MDIFLAKLLRYDFQISQRIHSRLLLLLWFKTTKREKINLHVSDVGIFEQSQDLKNSIHSFDVREKSVSETLKKLKIAKQINNNSKPSPLWAPLTNLFFLKIQKKNQINSKNNSPQQEQTKKGQQNKKATFLYHFWSKFKCRF